MRFVQTIRTFFGKGGLMSRFDTFTASQKTFTIASLGCGVLTGIVEVICHMNEFESRIQVIDRYIREVLEKRARKRMIGNDVAHGLAWSHYCGFLRYVLPEFEEKLKTNQWYIDLPDDDKKRLPMKLYELIPRKCYVDIPEKDEKMKEESSIVIEHEHKISGIKENITIKIYSIEDKDTKTKYYCLFDCPGVLKTFNTVIDVQVAGISRSKVQLFNFDAKLVQLMRFYYSLSCFNRIEEYGKKARLVLFNESDKKLSDVLLEAIQTDLGEKSAEQKTHRSLMETNLLSAEERKDVCYDYDCYITHANGKTDDNLKIRMETISKDLEGKSMKMLSEKDCFGKDWLERLKYASTKCRWIVFFDGKESTSDNFVDYNVVSSLKDILESRKVQTVAIVNEMRKPHIHDDLRWVTCIPNGDKDDYLSTTVYKVVSGSEVNLDNKTDLCLKQGDAAVGLAWGYAVDYLNMAISGIGNKIDTAKQGISGQFTLKKKLYIVVPKDCYARPSFEGLKTVVTLNTAVTDNMTVYRLSDSKYFAGQYASPVNIICQMNKSELVDEQQMQLEAKTFYITLKNIMRILLPAKDDLYEFIYFDGEEKKTLKEVMSDRVK